MNVGMALWALPLLLGSAARWDGQIKVGAQFIGGHSQSAFLTGPDSPPLLNTDINAGSRQIANLVVSPAGQLNFRARGQAHQLSYAPRLFLNPKHIEGRPTIFHVLALRGRWGRPQTWLVTLSPGVTIGGLDLEGAGAPAGTAFSGSTRPGTVGGIPAGYVSLNLIGRVEHPLVRGWRAGLQGRWTSMGSRASSGVPPTALGLPVAGGGLQTMQRRELQADAQYLSAGGWRWEPQAIFGYLNFPSTQSYLSATPSLSVDMKVAANARARLRLGWMVYNTGVLPGFYNEVGSMAVAEAGIDTSLARLALPRADLGLKALVGPYVDIVFGQLEPRSTLQATLAYTISGQSRLSLQGRYYSQRYPGRQVAYGHDKDLVMANISFRTRLSSFMHAQLGGYSIYRHRNPSHTDRTSGSNEYFLFVGADGTLKL